MFHCTILMFIIYLIIQKGDSACKPEFLVTDNQELTPGSTLLTDCNFQTSNDCTNIQKVEFIRWSDVNQTWDVAIELISNNPNPEFKDLLDGYNLRGRSMHFEQSRNFRFAITSTIIEDSGRWLCSVIDDTGDKFLSEEQIFQVTNGELDPDNITITGIDTDIFILSKAYTYWCSSPKVYPGNVIFQWITASSGPNGIDTSEMNGYVWNVNNTKRITVNSTTETEIKCVISKSEGVAWSGEKIWAIPDIVYRPGLVEYVTAATDQRYVECVVSGDNASISWTINNSPWNENILKEDKEVIEGNFAYGQTTALLSRLVLIPEDACQVRNEISGTFECTAHGLSDPSSKIVVLNFSSCDDLPWWAILLIVLICILASLCIGLLISWCCCKVKFEIFCKEKLCCCFYEKGYTN